MTRWRTRCSRPAYWRLRNQFGTLESCGEIWMMRSNYRKATGYFRRALDLNPNLSEAAEALHALEQKLENDRI